MAYRLLVSEKATRDLDGILSYIAEELGNVPAAAGFADKVETCYDRLLKNPYMFPACPQPLLQQGSYRKAILGAYLMIYRVDEAQGVVYVARYFSHLEAYEDKL